MFLAAMALAAQGLPSETVTACAEQPYGWSCQELWIETLPEDERFLVIMSLAGGLNLEVKNRLEPHVKSMRDICWVMGVQSFGKAMLADASIEKSDLWSYLFGAASVYARMIGGALSIKEGDILLKSLTPPGDVKNRSGEAASVWQKYKARLEKAEKVLIVQAKLAASSRQADVGGDEHTPFKGCRAD